MSHKSLARRMRMPTLYEILGVDPTASVEDIRLAYDQKRSLYDPNQRHFWSEERKSQVALVELDEAFKILSRKELRENYDSTPHISDAHQTASAPGSVQPATHDEEWSYMTADWEPLFKAIRSTSIVLGVAGIGLLSTGVVFGRTILFGLGLLVSLIAAALLYVAT